MKSLRIITAVVAIASLAAVSQSRAEDGATHPFQLSVHGGVQALNSNDTALPDQFLNVPAAAALSYRLNSIWAVEGEFAWMIPVKRSVDLGGGVTADRKTPDIYSYQANVLAHLPTSSASWNPYVTAGLGAMTFASNTDPDRYPQLPKSETAFAINVGVGSSFGIAPNWGVRADFRELAAFPSKDAVGLSSDGKADPIWMERGTLGLSYQF